MITISRLINRYKSNIAIMILPEHSDNDGEINPVLCLHYMPGAGNLNSVIP